MTTVQRPVTPDGGTPAAADRLKWLPGLRTLLSYQPAWLPRDLVAGLVLTALLVPAGMGYAEASGLPPIHGLYATIVPLIAYALFGPSRILVLGPDSSLAPLIAVTIIPLAAGDPEQAVALAGMLAVMVGVLCVAAGAAPLRVHHRRAVQAGALWLHERDRSHGPGRPAAQAVRVLGGRRQPDPGGRAGSSRAWGPGRPIGWRC